MNKIMISLNSPVQEKIKEFIKDQGLDIIVVDDMLHPEKEHYYKHILGSESDDIALIVTGYPSSINKIIKEDSDYKDLLFDTPLSKELMDFREPSPKIKVVNLFHLGLVKKKDSEVILTSFKDAIKEDNRFVIPPYTAPVPLHFKKLIEDTYGFDPLSNPNRVYPVLDPWHINGSLINNRYDIGMNIPYFANVDREEIDFKWPEDGAVTVPSCLAIRKAASSDVEVVAEYLFSREFQTFLGVEAQYYPRLGHIDYYNHTDKSSFSMLWSGWSRFLN